MSDQRKRVGIWPWIGAMLIGLPLLYVASFGPACWLMSRTTVCAEAITAIYQPIYVCWMRHVPEHVAGWINWYCYVGANKDWYWGKRPDSLRIVLNRYYPRDWPYHLRHRWDDEQEEGED